MNKIYRYSFLGILLSLFLSLTLSAQEFNGKWTCQYSTHDDSDNGTGYNVISFAVTGENNFVALVNRVTNASSYLVGYKNADSTNGRQGSYGYGTSAVGDLQQIWMAGFDQVFMTDAKDIAAKGNLLFVTNNDEAHNILVFEQMEDSVYSHPLRMPTNYDAFVIDSLWAIDVDNNGKVYVTTQGDEYTASKILIYEAPENESKWSSGEAADPLQVITLPVNGTARGIAVSENGEKIFVSNWDEKKIYCYEGDATNGYVLNEGFNFTYSDDIITDTDTLIVGPWDLKLLDENNILFMASHGDFAGSSGYPYGNIYAINPNNGAILDTLNVAKWNYENCDSSYSSGGDGLASGYTSVYELGFDENKNMYSQSYYGWAIDKWSYSGTLPTITSVESNLTQIPESFTLEQNYPNPFNPSTTISFGILKSSNVTINIYSITGELVSTICNSTRFSAGTHKVNIDFSNMASGIYLYSVSDGTNCLTKKMTLIK